ncbi:cholinesterase-like [Tachypleus tridentatus]|uniref:cholinesterase-like n=1 Tax=Tachypleus tridentatus TaxID=6853 RepID=UPI003FCF5555
MGTNLFIWLFSLTLGVISIMTKTIPQVHTTSGKLLGRTVETPMGHVDQYLGIPYAKAPIGNLRFQPPQPLDKEEAEIRRDATKFGPLCFQPPHLKEAISPLLMTKNNSHITTSEDCLTLNIFIPSGKQLETLAVMVWLPGEGFDYADTTQFDGSFLAIIGQVIVVTVNYRVSVFGFLSTLTPEAPGNIGFLDQRLALQWIQQNIAKFNGNNRKVTFFGRFSGAMSVSAHLASPLNDGENQLFQKAILQSGVATGQWIFDSNPLNATLELAKVTNCSYSSLDTVVSCLRQIPAETLLTKSNLVSQRWRPVFDGHFLTEDPLSAVSKGQQAAVDVILGVNNDEGSLCLLSLFAQKSKFYQRILDGQLTDEDFNYLLKTNLEDFLKKSDHSIHKVTAHEYQHFKKANPRGRYVDFCGSMYIKAQMKQLAQLLIKNGISKVFSYEFAHRPSFSIHPEFIQAGHGDDVLFTFGLVHKLSQVPTEELKLSRKIIAAFSNFAKSGNPNPVDIEEALKWTEFSNNQREVLQFSAHMENNSVKSSQNDRDVAFWYNVIPSLSGHEQAVSSLDKGERDLTKMVCRFRIITPSFSPQEVQYIIFGLVAFIFILLLILFIMSRYVCLSKRRILFTKF